MARSDVGHSASDSGVVIGNDGIVGPDVGAVDTSTAGDAPAPKRKGGWPAGKPRGGSSSGGSRDSGSGNAGTAAPKRSQEKAAPLDLSGIAAALTGIHMGIAMMSKQPHWELEEKEADAIAASVSNVARHYPKIAKSQKLVDWVMLAQTLGFMYVPRVLMTRDVLAEKRKKENANV
jgi:hypothetical protein